MYIKGIGQVKNDFYYSIDLFQHLTPGLKCKREQFYYRRYILRRIENEFKKSKFGHTLEQWCLYNVEGIVMQFILHSILYLRKNS